MLMTERTTKKSIDDAWANINDEDKLNHYLWRSFINLQRLMYKCVVIRKKTSPTRDEALKASIRQWRNFDELLKYIEKRKGVK